MRRWQGWAKKESLEEEGVAREMGVVASVGVGAGVEVIIAEKRYAVGERAQGSLCSERGSE